MPSTLYVPLGPPWQARASVQHAKWLDGWVPRPCGYRPFSSSKLTLHLSLKLFVLTLIGCDLCPGRGRRRRTPDGAPTPSRAASRSGRAGRDRAGGSEKTQLPRSGRRPTRSNTTRAPRPATARYGDPGSSSSPSQHRPGRRAAAVGALAVRQDHTAVRVRAPGVRRGSNARTRRTSARLLALRHDMSHDG